jgi:glutathione S-transferase
MPFGVYYSLIHGRTFRFPLLYGDGLRLNTVQKMIDHFEPLAGEKHKLVPHSVDPARIRQDWKVFHTDLNTATTVFAYYHLLPMREIMVRPLSEGAPHWQVAAVERAYPAFAAFIRLLLRPTDQRGAAALETIRTVMARIDERLADGRRYLLGDVLTLSDVAFAIAAAPVTWPEQYGGAVPPLDALPDGLRAVVEELRATPAGTHALRVYGRHRAPSLRLG